MYSAKKWMLTHKNRNKSLSEMIRFSNISALPLILREAKYFLFDYLLDI